MAEHREPSPDDYDVIICGTDLIQSILSSALSRSGKKVLHCDGNEWYGGFDAVLYTGSTLDCFIEGCHDAAACTSVPGFVSGEAKPGDGKLELLPREKYADLRLHSQTFLPSDEQQTAADLPPAKENEESFEKKEAESTDATEPITQPKDDSDQCTLDGNFSLDISPDLIYASGDAVQGLVKSGVSDYLEFKSLKGLYLLMGKDDTKKERPTNRRSQTKSDNNESTSSSPDNTLISYRVPCSKGDVFRSQLLSPVDKRRLMKFLQLISDYGLAQEEATSNDTETVDGEGASADDTSQTKEHQETAATEFASEDAMYSINERYLNKGRSLSRPQNKAKPSTSELDSLIRSINDNVDFFDYLINVAKLPPRLCSVVTHALALAPFGRVQFEHTYSTKNGVNDLLRHVSALGRFGDTAFLIPMYGSGELSQAFCRSGAVYGSTYMLRRAPLSIFLNKDGHDDNLSVRSVTLSGEEHIGGFADVDTDDTSNKEVGCSHVIVPSTMLPRTLLALTSTRLRIYRRISILKGSLMNQQENQDSEDTEQRYAVVIPPETHGLNNASAVHAIILDDSAFVAPARKGYTVLHLTTSMVESGDSADDACLEILSKSLQLLIDSQGSNDDRANECHHISFSYSADIAKPSEAKPIASGFHICYRDTQSITCDYAFREAKRIFEHICPGEDFLALAKKVEDSIVYKNNEDSDDERMVLSNAIDIINEDAVGELKPNDTAADDVVPVQNELANTKLDESINPEGENTVDVQEADKITE